MADPMRFPAPPAGGPPRRSPLGPLAERLAAGPLAGGRLSLSEVAFPGQLDLWGEAADAAFAAVVTAALGVAPPPRPGVVASGPAVDLLALGPGHWLAVMPGGREEIALRALRQGLEPGGGRAAGMAAAVADVSDARCLFDLGGPAAREVLAAGCPLDLHPTALPPGHCVASLLAGQPVIIQATESEIGGGEPALRLFVPASRARWLVAWMLDAAAGL